MKKFNYKFDSILKVKENFKKQAMKEVALIGKEIEAKTEKKQVLINELNQCKLSSNKTSMKVSELQFIESHIEIDWIIKDGLSENSILNHIRETIKYPILISHSSVVKLYFSSSDFILLK